MNRFSMPAALLALAVLVGCGGSSSPDQPAAPRLAKSLSYTNPTAAAGEWSLVQDARTTSTHLVLNLMGPSDGTRYRGVGFTLQADPARISFAQFTGTDGAKVGYYKDWGTFLDRNADGIQDVPTVLQSGGVSGGKLMVGIFQLKDDQMWLGRGGTPARDCSAGVLQIAIDLDPVLEALPGTVPLTVVKARVIPDRVNTVLTRKTVDVPLKVGVLELK